MKGNLDAVSQITEMLADSQFSRVWNAKYFPIHVIFHVATRVSGGFRAIHGGTHFAVYNSGGAACVRLEPACGRHLVCW
jgi:hypothetical protein